MSKTIPILFQCDCCHGSGDIEFKYTPKKKVECADCRGEGYVTMDKLRTKPKTMSMNEWPGPIRGMLALAKTTHDRGMKGSIPFKLGDVMQTLSGNKVVCIEQTTQKGYECVRFDDGAWRYNRDHDRGRCTASDWDDRLNVMPNYPVKDDVGLELNMIKAHLELDSGVIRMEIAGVPV